MFQTYVFVYCIDMNTYKKMIMNLTLILNGLIHLHQFHHLKDLMNLLLILKVLITEKQYMEHQDIVKETHYYFLMMVQQITSHITFK